MEQFRDRKPANERTYSTQTEAPPRLARLVGGLLRLLRMLRHDQRGVTGMETAILMVSFVGASSALGAAYVSSNFKIFEKVQATAGTTIDAIVEEGEAYMERQGISVPDGGLAPNTESVDFAALESALTEALESDSPYTIEPQADGTTVLTVDLSVEGISTVVDLAEALMNELGSELTYTVEAVPGEQLLLRLTLPPSTEGGASNTEG